MIFRKTAALFLAFLILVPSGVLAGPTIPGFYGGASTPLPLVAPNTLPTPRGFIQGVDRFEITNSNKGVIYQNQPKAIIDWNTFDIGKDASVHFDQQKNSNWTALNRIWDKNPSQIFGSLTADGHVYLINQNGILFGPGSTVNVHSLVASSLNLRSSDFLNGFLKFNTNDDVVNGELFYTSAKTPGNVHNDGFIQIYKLGSVFLVAPKVENTGTIVSPVGQIGLIAAQEAEVVQDTSNPSRIAPVIHILGGPGEAHNRETGALIADTGQIGMYGRLVNQDGLIRSVTAVKKAGAIELHASEHISTGPKSITSSSVSGSPETAHQSFVFNGGEVDLGGLMQGSYETDGTLKGFSKTPTGRIELRGVVEAPSGLVNLRANERVYIETGSKIDVSGVWVNKPASASVLQAQLNSVELRDDFLSKDGILKGKTIKFDALYGSAIGDVSGAFSSQEFTAREHATRGGNIAIDTGEGDLVTKEGSLIKFAGGGIKYGAGVVDTTYLRSGNKLYNISNADPNLQYSAVLELPTRIDARTEGNDAGALRIAAKRVVMDGKLDGSAVKGQYQTNASEKTNKSGNQNSRGTAEPRGGMLALGIKPLGAAPPETQDFRLDEVIIKTHINPLGQEFGPTSDIPSDYGLGSGGASASYLSAKSLNEAGLGRLEMYANTEITIEKNANISMQARRYLSDLEIKNDPGLAKKISSYFSAAARRIEQYGSIVVPGGEVAMSLNDNITSFENIYGVPNPLYRPLQQRIFLGSGSVLSVAGERIDISPFGNANAIKVGQINGGQIRLTDDTGAGEGIISSKSSLINVSGGYLIDQKGKVTGGEAGGLAMKGNALILDGSLEGLSILGKKGGTIALTANEVSVVSVDRAPLSLSADTELPEDRRNRLVLGQSQLGETGFTNVTVDSVYDLTVEQGAQFAPSLTKWAWPEPGKANKKLTTQVLPEQVGSSSINLTAGKGLSSADSAGITLSILSGATVSAFPGGIIQMQGPAVSIEGTVKALAGNISLKASYFDLTLKRGSQIFAPGYNKAETTPVMPGYPVGYTPIAGGKVRLEANSGNLILEEGSLVQVSGSAPVATYMKSALGNPLQYMVAGDAGNLFLAYGEGIFLGGALRGFAKMDGLRGGSLTEKSVGAISLTSDTIGRYQSNGFDDLTFQSLVALEFPGSIEASIARRLTLDAPLFRSAGTNSVSLSSPWIKLANTYYPSSILTGEGQAMMSLSGDWIDVEGSVVFSGFSKVSMKAQADIRLSDRLYELPGQATLWKGNLKTGGDLELQAGRIYPTTLSRFVISADRVITKPAGGADPGPISSAGGELFIYAKEIDHQGILAAPLGKVVLAGGYDQASQSFIQANRISIAEGSKIIAAGDLPASYGTTDETFWYIPDKASPSSNAPVSVVDVPIKSVTISGKEVSLKESSEISVAGGGVIFSNLFLPSPAGSVNPLKKEGSYVIIPGMKTPGEAVYLEGGAGLAPGFYSLLPSEYAFLPGAMVLTDLSKAGQKYSLGQKITLDGYPVVKGYSAISGTHYKSPIPKGYSIRKASDVLHEGSFIVRSLHAGEAGNIMVSGNSASIDGTLNMKALPSYHGGILDLSANSIFIGEGVAPSGVLTINPALFASMNLQRLNIGNLAVTQTFTLQQGASIDADHISIAARDAITLEQNAQLRAVMRDGHGGDVDLITPTGKLSVGSQSVIQASNAINLEASSVDLQGTLNGNALNLKGSMISFVPDSYTKTGLEKGLYLSRSQWEGLQGIRNIGLISASDIVFQTDLNLDLSGSLTFNASRIAAVPVTPGGFNAWNISAHAEKINLLNTSTKSGTGNNLNTATINLGASEVSIGHGNLFFDGFNSISLASMGDVTFKGQGSLLTGGADLTITAPRVTTSYYQDEKTLYEPVRFIIDAGLKTITIGRKEGATAGQNSVPGGLLEIKGGRIDVSGTVDVNSGQILLNASGSAADGSGILIREGGKLLATGSDYAPGGYVRLKTDHGILDFASGAFIDVSAGMQGDAGFISLNAPVGGGLLDGQLMGTAKKSADGTAVGLGGSLEIDTKQASDFTSIEALNDKLIAGGFNNLLDVRIRAGNVDVPAPVTISANKFRLTADQGDINLGGIINASGRDAVVELNAWNNLALTGSISARKSDGFGGDVHLNAGHIQSWDSATINKGVGEGAIVFNPSAVINVDGDGIGKGGNVFFRAYRNGDLTNINIQGTINGASGVYAETVQAYRPSVSSIGEYASYEIAPASVNAAGLTMLSGMNGSTTGLRTMSGIEIRGTGDLVLDTDWDMTEIRHSGQPGVLTLRAAGNLNIAGNLVDHPTILSALKKTQGQDSWGINLIAGADLESAYLLAIKSGAGNLVLGPDNTNPSLVGGKVVYTESAPIRFASGGDTLIRSGPAPGYMIDGSMRYTLGSYDGNIDGKVSGNLTLRGGAIQTATGNIAIEAGRDLVMGLAYAYGSTQSIMGSVRTTGEHPMLSPETIARYWEYSGGGNIQISAGGSVRGVVNASSDAKFNAWDSPYKSEARVFDAWGASYPWAISGYRTTEGITTMSGGNLQLRAGEDVFGQIGTFGQGNLEIYAGGNIDGRLLVRNGTGNIHAMANLGTRKINNQGIELFDARINVSAQGDIRIGSFVNPMITHWSDNGLVFSDWNLGYSINSSVKASAIRGDITLAGDSVFSGLATDYQSRERLLPATIELYAGRDIVLANEFSMAPSPSGTLVLKAGRDINGGYGTGMRSSIVVSDMMPSSVYGIQQGFDVVRLFSRFEHASTPIHEGDQSPILVEAGRDIKNLQLALPKATRIRAGQDIRDIYYFGQNVHLDDVSFIRADRDILFSSFGGDIIETGIVHGGSGALMVQAGNNVDLGTTSGIQTVGSGFNAALDSKGSDLILLAGIQSEIGPTEMKPFFNKLRDAGDEYAKLRAKGDIAGAEAVAEKSRKEIITPMVGDIDQKTEGNVNMVRSQISTNASVDHIYILAKGDLNVGKSTFVSSAERKNTGMFTAAGGSINILAGGDVNVNEARVMTFRGGDITMYALWNADSAVNAGRGSKTAISVEPPKYFTEYEYVLIDGVQVKRIKRVTQVFEPPAVGSGIRTLTYDPDGVERPQRAPRAGDIYIFAKTIDAGEAGIVGQNVTLGAETVLNAGNISFSGASVGVPVQSEAINLGALTGTTGLTEKTALSPESLLGPVQGKDAEKMLSAADDIMKWLEVKVINFDMAAGVVEEEEKR